MWPPVESGVVVMEVENGGGGLVAVERWCRLSG